MNIQKLIKTRQYKIRLDQMDFFKSR